MFVVHLLGKEGQNIGDGPFLISAVLNCQMEGGLRLFACNQLQTMQRVDVLDGTTLKKRRELSKISEIGEKSLQVMHKITQKVFLLNRFRICGLLGSWEEI